MIAAMLSHALHARFADSADQRRSDRRVLRLEARAATPAGAEGIAVHNLSRTGLLLEGLTGIAAGAEIAVELPGGSSHRAQVIWADEALFGCRFAEPLTQAQLSAALLRSAPHHADGAPARLTQAEAMARLREHWAEEDEETPPAAQLAKLPLGVRMRIIGALALAGWAVPAAAAWMFW